MRHCGIHPRLAPMAYIAAAMRCYLPQYTNMQISPTGHPHTVMPDSTESRYYAQHGAARGGADGGTTTNVVIEAAARADLEALALRIERRFKARPQRMRHRTTGQPGRRPRRSTPWSCAAVSTPATRSSTAPVPATAAGDVVTGDSCRWTDLSGECRRLAHDVEVSAACSGLDSGHAVCTGRAGGAADCGGTARAGAGAAQSGGGSAGGVAAGGGRTEGGAHGAAGRSSYLGGYTCSRSFLSSVYVESKLMTTMSNAMP